ncbi:hypothetical protein H671_2g6041 [Cricetulus griseus]|uniref:Uncharacterized protein n=1 Tax=Cricetulus griseus TaxID=10029 RepID=A0A061IF98_CRIGR|nr:hypothetical protein H671_2g6041 [Cricetulus griseus]
MDSPRNLLEVQNSNLTLSVFEVDSQGILVGFVNLEKFHVDFSHKSPHLIWPRKACSRKEIAETLPASYRYLDNFLLEQNTSNGQ